MARPVWFVNILKGLFPGRFFLASMTHLPIVGGVVNRALFNGDELIYLPINRSIPIHLPIEDPEAYLLPTEILHHFIEQASHHWLMNFCICRDSNHCKDYPIALGCLFLGEAVLGINPQLGRLVSKEEAHAHVRRCQEAGLVHLVGRNKLDTIWLGVGPGTKLLTVCNCCPCCCLWKMLPKLNATIGSKVHAMPGVAVTVSDRCVGCGTCAQGVCFVDAIHVIDGRAAIGSECRGCGRCVVVCPNNAIELHITDSRVIQAAIEQIASLVSL